MRQMEASPENRFLEFRRGRNVFAFTCPVCGSEGELGVRTDNRNRLVACPENCGAFFMVRYPSSLFSQAVLEFALGPRKATGSETQAKKKKVRRAS